MLDRSKQFITAILLACLAVYGAAQAQPAGRAPLALKPDAPDRYIVVPGDTLWSIAERFTDAPWRWKELWEANKDNIRDPNRIFPGDVIVLDRARAQLALAETVRLSPKVRVQGSTDTAVPSIPAAAIEPFLSRPLVVEGDGLEKAPTIVGTEDNRVVVAAGNRVYVRGIDDARQDTWYLYRRGNALVDPDTQQTLGFEAVYLGTGRLTRAGDPATVELTSTVQEVVKGDKLIAAARPVAVNYAPHAPKTLAKGRVIGIYGGVGRVGETGSHAIVSINRGKADGIEPGHVLALSRPGAVVGGATTVALPDERYGLVFVFRVFDRVAYALVMDVTRPVSPNDLVLTP